MKDKCLSKRGCTQLIHTFPTGKNVSEQDFSLLSTNICSGYYYYLYIQETHPQTNPTGFFSLNLSNTQLTKKQLAMQDFQLKKKRVAA